MERLGLFVICFERSRQKGDADQGSGQKKTVVLLRFGRNRRCGMSNSFYLRSGQSGVENVWKGAGS